MIDHQHLAGLLAVDIGNTNIHIGLWDGARWLHSWRAQTVPGRMPDEYAVLLRSFLAGDDVSNGQITGMAIGSVVPSLTDVWVEISRNYLKQEPLVVNHRINTGVRIAIDQPEQAGADRIINAAAVVALYGAPAIVIDFGTATTFDVVSRDGAYGGGAIAPGITLAHDALVARAARLHKIDLKPPACAIGTNTTTAMQSGIFLGYVGLVEGLVRRIKREMDDPDVQVIATGGLAVLFHENTDVIDRTAPELTLDGLRVIYDLNRG
ncbi:MAG: type III pantothenate kinase [Anaerolineae bacterium]|nr:type III pantothenate kinase [Anaerolineae bacterium]